VNPRGKNKDYNPDYICVQCEPFKLIINNTTEIICVNEEEFSGKTKLHNRVIRKLKKDLVYKIKRRQHNTLHDYQPGDTFKYHPLTLDEYKASLLT
jgi:hypothetical protein